MDTNKKYILIIWLGVAIIVAGFGYMQLRKTPGDKTLSNTFAGQVIDFKNNTLTANGMAYINNQTVKADGMSFKITNNTTFTKTVYHLNSEPNSTFTPRSETLPGSISDLKPDVRILNIQTKENILKTKSATAVSINYSVYAYDK